LGESDYHKKVIEFIRKFGGENNQKCIEVRDGRTDPLYILHPQATRRRILPIQYFPDLYFMKKNKNRIIFEVLDSELNDTNAIIADSIQSCLCGSVDLLVFIVPTDNDRIRNKIYDIFDTIRDLLIYLGIDERKMPSRCAVYYILKEGSRSYEDVKKILEDASTTDNWWGKKTKARCKS